MFLGYNIPDPVLSGGLMVGITLWGQGPCGRISETRLREWGEKGEEGDKEGKLEKREKRGKEGGEEEGKEKEKIKEEK